MADISAKTLVTPLTNELKNRSSVVDAFPADNSQFMEVMTARLNSPTPAGTSGGANAKAPTATADDDAKNVATASAAQTTQDTSLSARDTAILRKLKDLKNKNAADDKQNVADASTVQQTQQIKAKIKDKIKARIAEISAANDVPVENDQPLKALQKVAAFLLQASQEGKLDLPKDMVQKLQAFVDKGDDLKAADIAGFMRDFSEAFKSMIVNMNASPTPMKWPQEIVDTAKELGIGGLIDASKDVTVYDAARLVKALVNASEKAAIETINKKTAEVALPEDRAGILVNAAAGNSAAAKDPKDPKQPTATDIAATADTQSSVVTAQDDTDALTDLDAPNDAATDKAVPSTRRDAKAELRDEMKDKAAANTLLRNDNASNAANAAAVRTQLASAVSLPGDNKAAAAASSVTTGITNTNLLDALNNVPLNGTSATRFAATLNAATQNANNAAPSPATQQIMVQLQQRGNKIGSLTVQLSPAELGSVEVRLTTQRDGSVHAVIAAEKPETLALLQKDAAVLQKSLQDAGLNANAGSMSFNLREQRQSQNFDGGRKRFARTEIEEVPTTEIALSAAQIAVFSKDHVNYHA